MTIIDTKALRARIGTNAALPEIYDLCDAYDDLLSDLRYIDSQTELERAEPQRDVLMTCRECLIDDAYATCIGAYGDAEELPRCDKCCNHLLQEGYCWPLQQAHFVRTCAEKGYRPYQPKKRPT